MLNNKLFNSKTSLSVYMGKVWRTVETQEAAASLNIVDSMEEQGVLELLLDGVKPPYRVGTEKMHYLLKTAFRYPPLKYGSRFGTRLLPSFYYASEHIKTNLAETAYYRFVFLDDMQDSYNKPIDSKHSVFSVSIRSEKCLDLCAPHYSTIQNELTHLTSYSYTQAVGHWALENEVELIRFESARLNNHSNLAIAEPKVIRSKSPLAIQNWLCRTTQQRVSFSSRDADAPIIFTIDDFLLDGALPRPS